MEFQERADFSFEELSNTFVYFLLENKQVVYVGQTTQGFFRPFSHKDKYYDEIKIQKVEEINLDIVESFYIAKYKPKYNKAGKESIGVMQIRNIIRRSTDYSNYSVNDLKNDCKTYNIEILNTKDNGKCISADDYCKFILLKTQEENKWLNVIIG